MALQVAHVDRKIFWGSYLFLVTRLSWNWCLQGGIECLSLTSEVTGSNLSTSYLKSWKLLADTWWFTVRNLDQLICTGSSTHKLPVAICHNIKQKINLNPWRNMPVCTTGVSDCFQAMISVPNCWLCGLHL